MGKKKLRDEAALIRHAAQMREYRRRDPEKFAERSRLNTQRHRVVNPESVKNSRLVYRYGVPLKDYQEMLGQQNGLCAICSKPPSPKRMLGVDHDHKTGLVRALLCQNYNAGIGMFSEDPLLLEAAMRYLSIFSDGDDA